MKNIFLSFALLAVALSSYAAENLKPQSGDIATEVNISLFNGQQNVSVNGISLRYFFTENLAARLGLSYNGWSHSEFTETALPGGSTSSDLLQSTSNFGFSLGAEYHFKGGNRLSPYLGAEFGFQFLGTNDKLHLKDNAGNFLSTTHEYTGTTVNNVNAGTQFGIGIFTGLDFYIYKGLYTGVEFGLYYRSLAVGDWKKRDYDAANKSWTETSSKDGGKYTASISTFTIDATPTLKLGWKF